MSTRHYSGLSTPHGKWAGGWSSDPKTAGFDFFTDNGRFVPETHIFTKQRLFLMSNKFNANALSEYSKSYARRVAADFYQHHATISGQQILSLTPISQINLFVISSLSDKWQADAEKFRSAYFDFSNEEVQEAFQNFMNVVSQHISVRREHLEPLLADATRRAVVMIFDPRAYFDDVLRNQPDFMVTAAAMKQITRYTKINQFIPTYITQRLNGRPFVYVNQALSYLDEVLSQRGHELEHYDKFVTLFSEKLPMDVSVLLRSHVPDAVPSAPARSFFDTATEPAVPPAPLVAPPAPVPAAAKPETEAVDTVLETHVPVAESVQEPIAEASPQGVTLAEAAPEPEPVAPISQPTPMPTGAISTPTITETASAMVADTPEATPTLNDKLRETAPAESATVAEKFTKAPIESVARSISLNQKFRFINQLFTGNSSAYNQAIEEIDSLKNYGEALDLISYRYASQYMWDMSSDEVSELVEILKRRFS